MPPANSCRVCTADDDAYLCRPCLGEIERAIGDMTSLMHELSVAATKQTKVYRANGRPREVADVERWDVEQADIPAWLRSREGRMALPSMPLVVNLAARELLWIAGNTLSSWTRHLAESRGAELPTAEGMIGWLLTNVNAVRYDDAAAAIHDEITTLHRQMERAVDRAPSRLYAGPCHAELEVDAYITRCQRDLYAKPGAPEIRCDGFRGDEHGCGATHTPAERQEWLLESLDSALVSLDELFAALPGLLPDLPRPPRSIVQAWVRQGRLMDRGTNRFGELAYVGGEVLALVRAYKPHRYAPRPGRVAVDRAS